MAIHRLVLAAFIVSVSSIRTRAQDGEFVEKVLGREIIGPRQTLAETADYCESLIPRVPSPTTLTHWKVYSREMRTDALSHVIFRGEASTWRTAKTRVEWGATIPGGQGYRIKKLRYEAIPGLWIPALLYEPEKLAGKVPVIIDVNGHDASGKASDYKQVLCINLAKRGMLALNVDWYGMGQLGGKDFGHDQINHIDLCGTSGVATHFLAQTRAIDLALALENTDPERLAVTGLSGGGWQTIFVSAFDTRVRLCNPVAGYSSFRTRARFFSDLGDSEQTPCDLATVTDYAAMTAMIAPRAALLTFNAKDDCCFASDHALPPLLEAARPIFKLYGVEDKLRTHINHDPGTHNYLTDNRQAFLRMVGEQFFPGSSQFDAKEISCDSELKTPDELRVEMPRDNETLHGLASGLSERLPRDRMPTEGKEQARTWQERARDRLRQIVRARQDAAKADKVGEESSGSITAIRWRLQVGAWSVPVAEFVRGTPKTTVLMIGDAGRRQLAAAVRDRLKGNGELRVLVVDPFYLGESLITDHGYLFALLLAAVGDRPLGVQASQIAAVAEWAKAREPGVPVELAAFGPRTSVMALVAAGLSHSEVDSVVLSEPLGSLKELIETRAAYIDMPELFCFGLLEHFDVFQLAAMTAPRDLTIRQPNVRARKELEGLEAWYAVWGRRWNPFR
jgi:dienelactone hydrolase